MNRSKRQQLLGYLLGALDDAEQREVERRLASDTQWRSELVSLQACLERLAEDYPSYEPPAGLAERTCARVAEHAEACQVTPARSALAQHMESIPPPAARWSLADCVVVAGICLVATILFFPAISNSRYAAQLDACQNNLRQIGFALTDYCEKSGAGFFPPVTSQGNRAFAGVYAPVLIESGYLGESRLVLCPASLLVEQASSFRVPTLAEIDAADAASIVRLQERAGGSYGYSLGVVVNGKHRPPRNLGRPAFAIMSDTPVLFLMPQRSANHGGRGYNLLFEDGHIEFVEMRDAALVGEDPFRNRRGMVEAGLDENDAVVGRSVAHPFREELLPFDSSF